MPEPALLSPDVLVHIAHTLSVPMQSLAGTIALLDEGGAVPFIARYRRELADHTATILASIQEQAKLSGALKSRSAGTLEKSELEDPLHPALSDGGSW